MLAGKQTTNLASINKTALGHLPVILPCPEEQTAIAAVLSDMDAFMESLEQLIFKKRHLKQGAMQEFLTGKKRLPGFSGAWEEKQLGELGTWKGGMTPSMQNPRFWYGGTVPWISSGDVKSVLLTETASMVTEAAIKHRKTTLLPPKCIVVVTRSGILRRYLPVAMNTMAMAINQDIKALIPSEQYHPAYLLQMLIGNGDRILSGCLKAGTTVESVEFSWLKAFTVPMPRIEEQTAVATVLSAMDAEIAALESKLAKARQVKQGMMQNLLTGRIRLV
jgi:type I restriction enzyme S subunit